MHRYSSTAVHVLMYTSTQAQCIYTYAFVHMLSRTQVPCAHVFRYSGTEVLRNVVVVLFTMEFLQFSRSRNVFDILRRFFGFGFLSCRNVASGLRLTFEVVAEWVGERASVALDSLVVLHFFLNSRPTKGGWHRGQCAGDVACVHTM